MNSLTILNSTFAVLLSLSALNAQAVFAAPTPAAKLSADEIIAKADAVRNPGESYLMKVQITSEKESEKSLFEVSILGNTKTLVKTLEPSRDRGHNLLMLDQDMWAYVPNLKRSVRVGLNQRLTGQAANGDISRMRWSGDYSAKLESENNDEWVIYLTATKKGLTYEKARVHIRKKGYQPSTAQYLTLSGTPLKDVQYEGYEPLAGAVRPTIIQIRDTVRPDDRSTIQITEMNVKQFSTSLFNQNNLQ